MKKVLIKPHENQVYVISLNDTYNSIYLLEEENKYSMPVGNYHLKYSPEFLGIRYYGELKRISHVDRVGYEKDSIGRICFVFYLGPNLKHDDIKIKSGPLRDRRGWADFDLLFTCDTVYEAIDKTKQRNNNI